MRLAGPERPRTDTAMDHIGKGANVRVVIENLRVAVLDVELKA